LNSADFSEALHDFTEFSMISRVCECFYLALLY
jgi:hypothetical protein